MEVEGPYPNTGEPYLLTFEPSEGAEPSVGALKAFLGDFKRALTGRGVTPELVFPPVGDGRRWRIVVIATVEKASGLDLARVQSISFRRDPVEAERATNLD